MSGLGGEGSNPRNMGQEPKSASDRGEAAPQGYKRTPWGCWGVREGAKGNRGLQASPGASSGPKRWELIPEAVIFWQPFLSQKSRPISGKLKEIQPGRYQMASECALPNHQHEGRRNHRRPARWLLPRVPSRKLSILNPKNSYSKTLTPFLAAGLSRPPKPSKPQTRAQWWDASFHRKELLPLILV